MKSYDDPEYPLRKDSIRATMSKVTMMWEENGNTVGEEVATFNLGGYFPMRLLNMANGSITKKAIEDNYKKLLAMQNEKA